MSQALYRKYRSKSLDDVVGQGHITNILSRALASGRIAHAYLFTGPRGVGKTSIARILAHEINQLPYSDDSQHLDIIEIDAASNNGVEDVRDLREKVQIAPVSANKKVYIIDEVHMLSKQAFNALLKTLEEPPEHIVFILATTDVEKLPATIISRTQRYGFRAINTTDAVAHLKHIAKEENITVTDDALQLIAERGDGSFRDSISLLDQLTSLADDKNGITVELIETSLGLAPSAVVDDIIAAVHKHDIASIAALLTKTEAEGISTVVLTTQLIQTLKQQAVAKPELLLLLDALLDVSKSSHPSIKLLSVLGSAAIQHDARPKSAALLAPVLEVSASVEELANQATKKHPKIEAPAPAPAAKASPTSPSATTAPAAPVSTPAKSAATPAPEAPKEPLTAALDGSAADFNWEALIEHTRSNYVALYSVLSKCTHELTGNDLTLYTTNAFYKKKLDDPKYSAHLYESVAATAGFQPTIHTIPTRAPMQNSQAAAIADIMGGGIEVSPEAA